MRCPKPYALPSVLAINFSKSKVKGQTSRSSVTEI